VCTNGTIDQDLTSDTYLTFSFTDGVALRAVDHEWQFSDDAPSVLLRDQAGRNILRTVVTKPGDCTQLKVCAIDVAEEQFLVPIGLLLFSQETFAAGPTCGGSSG